MRRRLLLLPLPLPLPLQVQLQLQLPQLPLQSQLHLPLSSARWTRIARKATLPAYQHPSKAPSAAIIQKSSEQQEHEDDSELLLAAKLRKEPRNHDIKADSALIIGPGDARPGIMSIKQVLHSYINLETHDLVLVNSGNSQKQAVSFRKRTV